MTKLIRSTPDPVDHRKTFPDKKAAIDHYEAFVLKWTESQKVVDEQTGEEILLEEGNLLAPVAPPDPNRPSTAVDDDVGAW